MHQCTHCQADLADNAQFCSRCGLPAEKSQTHSADLHEVDAHEEELETTSKQTVVTIPITPSTPALPTLRTRRMHPNPSMPEFPQNPWLPAESPDNDESSANVETPQNKQSTSAPLLQLPLTPPVEIRDDFPQTLATSEESEIPPSPQLAQAKEVSQASVDSPALSALSTDTPEDISTSPTGDLAQIPAYPKSIAEDISTSPTGDLAQVSAFAAAKPDAISTAPTGELKYTSPFPPPTPERRSTPRPESTMALPRPAKRASASKKRADNARALIVALLILALVLAAGAGAFALVHQNSATATSAQCNAQQANCASSAPAQVHGKPTHLTFSGAVTGPMSIVAKPRCQISTAGNLRVLTLNLSGTITDQLYNFGFVIEHYNGPATYSNSAATTTILFDLPGQSTTNGWGNSTPTDSGSITIERGEQTGSISYTLSGVGSQAHTQIQAVGNWTCGH